MRSQRVGHDRETNIMLNYKHKDIPGLLSLPTNEVKAPFT